MSDITTLAEKMKAAAEKATPGRIGDRIDGSGSIKYQCVGYDGSLVLQTDHKNMEYGFIGDNGDADEEFFRACVPDVILALVEALEKESGYASAYESEKWHYHQLAESEGELADRAEKKVAFLKERLSQLANFNPDWDMLEAATESLREHMAELKSAQAKIAELEARTLTVKLPQKSIYRADEMVKEVGASIFAVPIAVVIDALGESGIKLQIEE